MSDTATSGTQGTAPAETSSAPEGGSPSNNQPAAPAQFGSFGTNRGSGLARGKRTNSSAAAPAPTKTDAAGYQPTAIEIVTPEREYHNPFASEQPAAAPAAKVEPARTEPAAPAAVVPVETTAPAAPAPEPVKSEPVAAAPAPIPAPAPVEEQKAELNILPPAETKRPAQSWESADGAGPESRPRGRREERPTFRPERHERRDEAGAEPRPFAPRENREPREPRESREPRAPRPEAPVEAPAAKSGGFIGWLKGLFAGKPEETPAATETRGEHRHDGEHRHNRRRHRGGRGRHRHGGPGGHDGHGEHRGPGGHQGEGHAHGEGSPDGGQRRRRRRGGRNRHRGDRGGRPHSEGQQGGGAI